jgi:hypothetical protein
MVEKRIVTKSIVKTGIFAAVLMSGVHFLRQEYKKDIKETLPPYVLELF